MSVCISNFASTLEDTNWIGECAVQDRGTQRMTGLLGTVVGGSRWRLREVDRELAPPSHLLLFKSAKKQNLRQGGGDICRGINREAERQRLTRQSCLLPYRPPSGGGMLTTHFKRRRA